MIDVFINCFLNNYYYWLIWEWWETSKIRMAIEKIRFKSSILPYWECTIYTKIYNVPFPCNTYSNKYQLFKWHIWNNLDVAKCKRVLVYTPPHLASTQHTHYRNTHTHSITLSIREVDQPANKICPNQKYLHISIFAWASKPRSICIKYGYDELPPCTYEYSSTQKLTFARSTLRYQYKLQSRHIRRMLIRTHTHIHVVFRSCPHPPRPLLTLS